MNRSTAVSFRAGPALCGLALALLAAAPAFAAEGAMSEAFKGLGSNSKDPIQIEADSLEVLDRDRNAVFTGNVNVRQRDTVLKTQRLKVFYEGKGGDVANQAAGGASQKIRRFEADGRILINQKDQTVTGDRGWFDMPSQTAQITGSVVLTQGNNVARGDKLSVDLTTGRYKLENTGGRVQLILEPQQKDGAKPAGQ